VLATSILVARHLPKKISDKTPAARGGRNEAV
jgi:hypothetical protein